ncbi:uncharacterized protein LOC108702692 isoform X2 [Xenopus laevis]|nr:uncharacterized protein LOC108702692 isoform X2 [Xenopus laevis]
MSEEKERQRNRTIDKEAQRANLVKSGNRFITKFISAISDDQHLPKEQKDKYIQRLLHAIFFIGYVNDPSVSPMEFLSNINNLWEVIKKKYPEPCEKYLTHLPRQTPYSILLEYMGRNMPSNDTELMKKLVTFNTSLLQLGHENQEALMANDFSFAASVIACSKYDDKKTSISTYGASLSCKGKDLRKLMIAISTLHVWHKAISYVVCCGNRGDRIEFYNHFYCNAFNVAYNINAQKYMYIPVSPCKLCHKMYKNVTFCPGFDNKNASWAYGNCGETESFSKLLLRLEDSKNYHLFTVINSKEKSLNGLDIEDTFNKEHKKPMTDYVNNILKQRKFNFDPKDWQLFSPV